MLLKGVSSMSYSEFQFTPPLLIKAKFEMLMPPKDGKVAAKIHLHRSMVKIEGKSEALVELTLQINKYEEEILKDAVFYVDVTMQSNFKWENSIEEDLLGSLLEKNAVALLLSYIRPIVANLTNSSPISAYNIPYINLDKLFEKTKNVASVEESKDL